MLILLSPSKTLDFQSNHIPSVKTEIPRLLNKAERLAQIMKEKPIEEIRDLMGISDALAELNFQRYQEWRADLHDLNGKPALFVFKGDVYEGFHATPFPEKAFVNAEKYLRILSGLYGILRPFDLIMPYRLEMGTALPNPAGSDLYAFWRKDVTHLINDDLKKSGSKVLLNLASNEYFKVVNQKEIQASIISPEFRDFKDGSYKMISFFAKRARGLMAAWVLRNSVTEPSDLLAFSEEGYSYNDLLSEPRKPVFTRG
ncbi:MAG: peroxide stress protein YaaA [Bacteroidales bacterium]